MVLLLVAVGGFAWAGNLLNSAKTPEAVRSFHLTAQNLSKEQVTNAKTIIGVGKNAKIGDHGIQIALMTALQESKLENLDHGDRDSKGLFQQRPSQDWGTDTQVQDPVYSAKAFYGINANCPNVGLTQVNGWRSMPKNDAAQKVQGSGHPSAYEKWEDLSHDILKRFADSPPVK